MIDLRPNCCLLFSYSLILSISVILTLDAASITFNSRYLLCIIRYVSISPCSFADSIQSCRRENSTMESFIISDILGIKSPPDYKNGYPCFFSISRSVHKVYHDFKAKRPRISVADKLHKNPTGTSAYTRRISALPQRLSGSLLTASGNIPCRASS